MSYSTFQAHTHNNSEGSKEFSFWTTSSEKCDCENNNQLENNETILKSQAEFGESSRRKDILEGKKELMEMMHDMHESSYELSFQDMVVEKHQVPPQPEPETEPLCSKAQNSQQEKLKKMKKKEKEKQNKSNRPKIMRVESMDSETFLLKMFFPISLDWMKKTKVQKDFSKVSSKSSFQESINEKDKEWRIKRFFTQDRQNTGSSSSSNDKSSRHVDRSFSFSQGCWPFFHHINSKIKKIGGG